MNYRIINTTLNPVLKTNKNKSKNKHKTERLPDYSKFFGLKELEELKEKHKNLRIKDLNKTKQEKGRK